MKQGLGSSQGLTNLSSLGLFFVFFNQCFAYKLNLYTCMPVACGSQKRVSGPLKLVLQAAMSHHVGAMSQT